MLMCNFVVYALFLMVVERVLYLWNVVFNVSVTLPSMFVELNVCKTVFNFSGVLCLMFPELCG